MVRAWIKPIHRVFNSGFAEVIRGPLFFLLFGSNLDQGSAGSSREHVLCINFLRCWVGFVSEG